MTEIPCVGIVLLGILVILVGTVLYSMFITYPGKETKEEILWAGKPVELLTHGGSSRGTLQLDDKYVIYRAPKRYGYTPEPKMYTLPDRGQTDIHVLFGTVAVMGTISAWWDPSGQKDHCVVKIPSRWKWREIVGEEQ